MIATYQGLINLQGNYFRIPLNILQHRKTQDLLILQLDDNYLYLLNFVTFKINKTRFSSLQASQLIPQKLLDKYFQTLDPEIAFQIQKYKQNLFVQMNELILENNYFFLTQLNASFSYNDFEFTDYVFKLDYQHDLVYNYANDTFVLIADKLFKLQQYNIVLYQDHTIDIQIINNNFIVFKQNDSAFLDQTIIHTYQDFKLQLDKNILLFNDGINYSLTQDELLYFKCNLISSRNLNLFFISADTFLNLQGDVFVLELGFAGIFTTSSFNVTLSNNIFVINKQFFHNVSNFDYNKNYFDLLYKKIKQ